MKAGVCVLCGWVGPISLHHITGRPGPGRPYLDPDIVIPLCPPCHTGTGGVHPLLRVAGLAWPRPGEDLDAFRLRRLGFHARLASAAGRRFVLDSKPSDAFAGVAFGAGDRLGSPGMLL